ncbi:fimbria/pilus outer membrane usher protein [Pseudomonas sp. 5P_3.1_Bac2]|uniref:fimbria/pilus outer membrane usher protein n=1 Tax=Pseudomonas sp. 5P_3.1_Bac2 TaxID=2971617 RepID=UPI0021C8F9E7|nr:fimbria/pilus outer membrane usher protein [Pseudomonas sp. 5P_3.1_Bac2]MCU1717136.1 fimbria/pilus outer membrane usher protein [Pseudomonas sp. 5P_3.1_Bac2]
MSRYPHLILACLGLHTGFVGQCLAANKSPELSSPGQDALFDREVMKQRGLDPSIAEYFRKSARFTAGVRRVDLVVNGAASGKVDATFNHEGQLCFDRKLLDQANLKIPAEHFLLKKPSAVENTAHSASCYDYQQAFPQTEVTLNPAREQVALVVSADTLRPPNHDYSHYARGGVAGLINYDLTGLQNDYASGSSYYYASNTEVGFNADNWLVRSRQVFTAQNQANKFQSLYTYAQTSFESSQSTLQIGEINLSSVVFPGAAITGLQLAPEQSLRKNSASGATVTGIAQSQARVEVRQLGALVHTTLVPAGPFRLSNIQLLNGNADLDVRVIEANGEQRSFVVPAASLGLVTLSAPGFSWGVGKVRTFEADDMQAPLVATGSGGWLLSPTTLMSAGLMTSDNDYYAGGVMLDAVLGSATMFRLRHNLSSDQEEGVSGMQVAASLSTKLSQNLTLSTNLTRQTAGHRDLLDTTRTQAADFEDSLNKSQYGFAVNWTHEVLGGFSSSYTSSGNFSGRTVKTWTAAWSRSFRYAIISATIERSQGSSYSSDENAMGSTYDGNASYVTISIPLGSNRSLRAYSNKRDGTTRLGTTYNETLSDVLNYRLSAENNSQTRERDYSGNVDLISSVAQINLGYAKNGEDSTSYNGQVRGGIALHGEGLTLSPYQIADTFAIAKLADVSGVQIATGAGPVWTDHWGRAVIPQLSPYQTTRIDVAGKSLPRNIDIQNGHKTLTVSRGSVSAIEFPVVVTRRVLLHVTDGQGQALQRGASVVDKEGGFVTMVVEDGQVFLNNAQPEQGLRVQLNEQHSCNLTYHLPEEANLEAHFETTEAVCH